MGKIHLDRLRKRHGWTGGKYRQLMQKILAANDLSIANAVGRVKVGRMKATVARMGPKWRTLALPALGEVLPKRSVFIRKGADNGTLLADDLRDRLTKNLRDAMKEMETKTGRPGYVKLTGPAKGRISEDFVNGFEAKIRETFEGYTKVDPNIGVPPNVRAIAITECRGTVNTIKHSYFERLAEKNPGIEVRKRWKHNPQLSLKEPRPGHAEMDGKEIEIDDLFEVPAFEKVGGKWEPTGAITLMAHPHDSHAGPEEVISCHCDADYVARRSKR
jgi:hypothetical protein